MLPASDYNVLVPLPWDSDFLGFPVARLELQALSKVKLTRVLSQAREQGLRLLYLVAGFADALVIAEVTAQEAWLADKKVTYSMSLIKASLVVQSAFVRQTGAFTEHLEGLAWQSGEYSRFRLDPRFEEWVYKQMYSDWLRNSLTGQLARTVLTYGPPNVPEQGLITLGEKNGRADIGILAVDKAYRGHGVGQVLVAAAQQQAYAWGYTDIQVVTQMENTPACRFYERCGFVPAKIEYIYHLWL